uniref:Peptidyl-prolyl cis-trans isomerase n=1 Tax=Macrostomum lignano TaxID=282301 RepID=A0A1I8JRD5_9PLAT
PTRHRRCAAPSAAAQPRDSGIAEAAPSRPSSASHAILAAAATAGLLMAAGADGAARQQQGIRFDIRAGAGSISASEIRANMDIQRFLKEATLLLDVEGAQRGVHHRADAAFHLPGGPHESHHSSGSGGGGGDGGSVAGAAGAIDSRLDAKISASPRQIKSISVVDKREGLITDNSWLCTIINNINKINNNSKNKNNNSSRNNINNNKNINITQHQQYQQTTHHRQPAVLAKRSQKRHVAIARLSTPVNLGRSSEGVSFILLKGTKSDIELGRTFATILADSEFRQKLLLAETESEFKEMLQGHATRARRGAENLQAEERAAGPICNGIRADLKAPTFALPSDFIDG